MAKIVKKTKHCKSFQNCQKLSICWSSLVFSSRWSNVSKVAGLKGRCCMLYVKSKSTLSESLDKVWFELFWTALKTFPNRGEPQLLVITYFDSKNISFSGKMSTGFPYWFSGVGPDSHCFQQKQTFFFVSRQKRLKGVLKNGQPVNYVITQFGTLRLLREPVLKFTKIVLIVKLTKIVLMRRNGQN